jgi:hypothetical protein
VVVTSSKICVKVQKCGEVCSRAGVLVVERFLHEFLDEEFDLVLKSLKWLQPKDQIGQH